MFVPRPTIPKRRATVKIKQNENEVFIKAYQVTKKKSDFRLLSHYKSTHFLRNVARKF